MMTIKGEYFYGNKISDYGIENGYVDYGTLAKAFDAVLNNEIMSKTYDIGYWEQVSGAADNQDEILELDERNAELADKISELEERISDAEDELSLDDNSNITAEDIDELYIELRSLEDEQSRNEEEMYRLEREDGETAEVFQWYIVDDSGASLLQEINEVVFYNEELDMYLWGVTHWGTAWSHVLTDIKIDKSEKEWN